MGHYDSCREDLPIDPYAEGLIDVAAMKRISEEFSKLGLNIDQVGLSDLMLRADVKCTIETNHSSFSIGLVI